MNLLSATSLAHYYVRPKTPSPRGDGDEGRNIAESAEPTLLIKNPPRYHALQGGVGFIYR